ncbi:MAG: hypothetical protein QG597_155 [Actinomycetota bacterium]|nr:hypothetical protein [Actinomycetota bacterium]
MSAARHLHIAPSAAEVLADEISAICEQIDRRLGNPPDTAEAGLYFWYWPPGDLDADVLAALHADAVDFLHTLTQSRGLPA